MSYKVISLFRDLKDGGIYQPGDVYPRAGVKPAKARIDELASNKNKLGKPLIEAVRPVIEPVIEAVPEPKQRKPKKD